MTKPELLRDLGKSEVRKACKDLFNGNCAEEPFEGYYLYPPAFDDLSDHLKENIIKAVGLSRIENLLDHGIDKRTELERMADEEAELSRREEVP
jgi:hypothetical protein